MKIIDKNMFKFLQKWSAVQIITVGFLLIILFGALVLSLPVCSADGSSTNFIDSLFTATSAVCVTGLVVFDTSVHWSLLGKVVIISLIQIGGLGFMTIATMISLIRGKKINLKERLIIQESLNQFDLSGIVNLTRQIIFMVFTIEAVGGILLSINFIPKLGPVKGLMYGMFHSISAFCNAGFDLMGSISGQFSSLTSLYDNIFAMIVISLLIILGGIGYPVILDFLKNKRISKLNAHSKLVIASTAILLLIGFVFVFAVEYNNPDTLGNMNMKGKLLSSAFQSTTLRTAGFNSIDLSLTKESTIFLMIIFMFIGASPASTGGGIKTTTIAVLFLTVKDFLFGKDQIQIFERSISTETIRKSMVIFFMAISIVIVGTLALSLTNPQFSILECAFEVTSAYATVGLSIGGSPNLNIIGKFIIMILMFLGRVGSLTIFTAILSINIAKKDRNIKRPNGKIIVG
ncbi:MAG: TrkH family potassium uptake protein [Intestinibacter sp.]|uniref:TrkH family potassium uptake protein n=1 Tax=Intestinibacter sp. TaxID=1965304 RepID=UPI0025B7A9D6|nr:TrkH family potassium uptake protein [Intestinibacter sp.]MCI6738841.1 TrkH family potassium uptake protein [Intestinibacter sp.]